MTTDVKIGKVVIGQVVKTDSPMGDYYAGFLCNDDGTRESVGGCGGCCAGIRAHDLVIQAYYKHLARASGSTHFHAAGYVTRDGLLHLFEDSGDCRKYLDEIGMKWSQAGWILGVEFHPKAK